MRRLFTVIPPVPDTPPPVIRARVLAFVVVAPLTVIAPAFAVPICSTPVVVTVASSTPDRLSVPLASVTAPRLIVRLGVALVSVRRPPPAAVMAAGVVPSAMRLAVMVIALPPELLMVALLLVKIVSAPVEVSAIVAAPAATFLLVVRLPGVVTEIAPPFVVIPSRPSAVPIVSVLVPSEPVFEKLNAAPASPPTRRASR